MNLLFISKGCPNSLKSAGDVRALRLLEILKEKYDITCWFSSADFGYNEIVKLGITPVMNGAEWVFEEICSKFKPDVILISHWSVAQRYMKYIRLRTNVPIIVDTIDVEFLRLQREHDYRGEHVISQRDVERVKMQELDIYRQADKIITVTEIDKNELLRHSRYKINVIPCIFEIKNIEIQQTNHCYTICNWSHSPNIEATKWLCEKIMPKVDVILHIVGKHPPADLTRFTSDKIVFENCVFDLDNFVKDKFACLAPILWGAGMNGKIGESLSYGIPTITSTIGAMPWGLKDMHNALIGDNVDVFVGYVNILLENKTLWKKLSENGKEHMKQYTKDNLKQKILEII